MRRVAGILLLLLLALEAVAVAFVLLATGPPREPLGWVALVGAVTVGGLFFWAYLRITRRMLRPEPAPATVAPRAHGRPPVAPVTAEALDAVPEPVTACPDCGYLGVRMPQLGDGVVLGGGEIMGRVVCGRCGYQGLAVRFETREEYGAFLRELSAAKGAPPA